MPSVNTRSGAFVMKRGDGRPIQVPGGEVTIKISSRDTGGEFAVFEGQTRPLEGPPLHLHRNQDEWWFILEGEYRFEVNGQELYAGAGSAVFAPRGVPHTFQNVGTRPGRLMTTVVPGGLDLFFEEVNAAAPDGTIPDPATMLPIFEKYGLELLGPPLAARSVPVAAGAD
jgi:mannose-6-phosphate isomerase-like protein (cupin superfamily)